MRIGDLLATLVSSQAAKISLRIDGKTQINTQGHVVLVANMPYLGPHYPVTSEKAFIDGLLDVLVFANLTKLELLGNAVQTASGGVEDARIHRFRAQRVTIKSDPAMPVMVDGYSLGQGRVNIKIQREALTIIAGDLRADGPSDARTGLFNG